MNIGIYSPYLDTLTGGEKYIFTAASCLSSEHKVTVFWDDPSILQKASEKFNLDLSLVTISKNVFTKDISLLKRLILTNKYDRILYLSDGSIPLVASKKLFIHFQFPVEWVNTNSFPFLLKKSRISKIICNSYFTKKFIDKKFNVNSYVLYPPSDTNTNPIPPKENIILTVGRFSVLTNKTDFKKLGLLVNAFKKFQKKRLKGWKFTIVTSVMPDMENEFEDFQKNINSTAINVYKNTSYQEIINLYGRAKIYWHASGFGENLDKHPERAEHFGISTVEAMSYGAVPVVIDAGGQPEIVKNNENGMLWNSEDELIDMTHRIAVDRDLFEKLSANAVVSSKNFTIKRFCEELNHLIW